MEFNQEFYDNAEPFEWDIKSDIFYAFVSQMEREPEDEQELIDWYESKA